MSEQRPNTPIADTAHTVKSNSPQAWDILLITTTAYLALPLLIFLGGWLKLAWALPLILFLSYALIKGIATAQGLKQPFVARSTESLRWWQWVTIVAVVVFVTAMNGAGGVGVQNWDWEKHNAILLDLTTQPWPVLYEQGDESLALVYYLAYYLPSALLGKFAGWPAANLSLFVWTVLGCLLAVVWMRRLSRARWWITLLLFVLFSGMDLAGRIAWTNPHSTLPWWNDFDAEWWNGLWTLPSNLTLIAYAPHQAIGGWLCSALLIDGFRRQGELFQMAVPFLLCLLWSPLGFVGLALLAVVWLVLLRADLKRWFRNQWRPASLAALPVAIVVATYFASRFFSYDLTDSLIPSHEVIAKGGFYVTATKVGIGKFIAAFLLTALLEFGLIAGLIFALKLPPHRLDRALLLSSVIVIASLLWFHYGRFNDLVMRASIPALFALQLAALRVIDRSGDPAKARPLQRTWRTLLLIVLCLGALYPLNMARITFKRLQGDSWRWVYIRPEASVPDLFEQQRQHLELIQSVTQYIGNTQSPFFRHLARAPRNKEEAATVGPPTITPSQRP